MPEKVRELYYLTLHNCIGLAAATFSHNTDSSVFQGNADADGVEGVQEALHVRHDREHEVHHSKMALCSFHRRHQTETWHNGKTSKGKLTNVHGYSYIVLR